MKAATVAPGERGPMSAASPESPEQIVPFGRGTNSRRSEDAASRRMLAAMEHDISVAGTSNIPTDALAKLRLWQSDPRLNPGTRRRANAMVWKLQPNGWDEV